MTEYSLNKFQTLFSEAIPILETLEKNNYKAYFVGGCVRDYVMNKNFNDIDITTSAHPNEVKKIFLHTIDTGLKHGTVTVKQKNKFYEITTFRSESSYINHRFPEKVEYITNLEEDLKRRDFTINAMAIDKDGNVTDYHNGISDIKNKIIRTVNDANERFNEDALRMIRAFRFASQLDFYIDKITLLAITNNKKLISYISIERIVLEFRKIFKGISNVRVVNLILETKINKFIPFFKFITNYVNCVDFTFEQAIYYLSYLNKIDISEIKKLKLSNKEINKIKLYQNIQKDFEEKKIEELVYKYGKEDVLFINGLFKKFKNNDIKKIMLTVKSFSNVDIEVIDILKIFPEKKPGDWIKNIINDIESKIILNVLPNSKNDIIRYIIEVYKIDK